MAVFKYFMFVFGVTISFNSFSMNTNGPETHAAPVGVHTFRGKVPDYDSLTKTLSPRLILKLHEYQYYQIQLHKYKSEMTEDWSDSLIGDCDDYAVYTHLRLAEMGIYSDLVLVETEKGETHLIAKVDNLIFDNRYKVLRTKEMVPYKFISKGNLTKKPWIKY